MKKFKGAFGDTEVTEIIDKYICKHAFILKKRRIIVSIFTKKGKLKPAIINHFNSWTHSSLSNSERDELYAVYQIEGQGKKTTGFGKYILVIESIGIDTDSTDINIENTECLEEFYRKLAN